MRCRILFEDEHLLVVYKPAGMPTQSASVMQTDVVSELKTYLKKTYIGLVHRLDQPVEGLFVVGKTQLATDVLTRQLHDGRLKKSYFALAADERDGKAAADDEKKGLKEKHSKEDHSGENVIEELTLTDYILKNAKTRTAEIVTAPDGKAGGGKQAAAAKKARLTCKVIEEDGVLHCRIDIQTGRFHQIRAQMSHAKMPLLGDRKYGTESSQALTNQKGIRQLCLCADRLVFLHPISGMKLEYEVSPSFISEENNNDFK
ncbi:MAG: hypothetical protein K6E75_11195 [Lachnospiraceae bacterium]|nr:hypothetical protein [Lachnospiraceae bacterium]